MFAGEFVKQILRFFTQHVDQHVQTTTVRHTQHHFTRSIFARVTDHVFQHRNQRIATFQGEAFSSREFRAQITFQTFCCGQLFQERFLFFIGEVCTTDHGFDTLLDPAFLFGVGDVHVFHTDGAAIGLLQGFIQLAELHGFFADGKRTDVEGFLEISFGQMVERRVKIGHIVQFPQAEGIKVRVLMATEAEGVD